MSKNKDVLQQPQTDNLQNNPEEHPKPRHTKLKQLVSRLLLLGVLLPSPVFAQENNQANPDTNKEPTNSESAYSVYFPLLESSDELDEFFRHQKKMYQAIAPYFPELVEEEFVLGILDEEDQPGLGQAMKAWQFWFTKLYPDYVAAKQQTADAGIDPSVYFQNTVEEVVFNFLLGELDGASLETVRTPENRVTRMIVRAHYADAEALMGEYIHFLQQWHDLQKGLTRIDSEAVSTIFHYVGLTWWHGYNQIQIDAGRPEDAVVMPILDTNREVIEDPTPEEFNRVLYERLLALHKTITVGSDYLYEYTGEENSVEQYSPNSLILFRDIGKDTTSHDYQTTIERLSAVKASLALTDLFTPADVLKFTPLTLQGKSPDISSYSENIQQAYQTLREKNLLLDEEEWKTLVNHYSTINIPDLNLAVHPVFTVRTITPNPNRSVLLQAFSVTMGQDIQEPIYTELVSQEKPTAMVRFFEDGEWWEIEANVKPQEGGGIYNYEVNIPSGAWVPGIAGIRRWVRFGADRQLVIYAYTDTIRGVPMGQEATAFTLPGDFNADVQSNVAEFRDDPEYDESLVAHPSTDPAVKTTSVAEQPTVDLKDLTEEQQAYWRKTAEKLKEVNASLTTTYNSVESPPESPDKDQESRPFLYIPPAAILPNNDIDAWLELIRRLNS